jgi:hypothetical protein
MVGVTDLNIFFTEFAKNTVTFVLWNLIPVIIVLIAGYIIGKVFGAVIQKLAIASKIDKYVKLKGFKISNLLKIAGEWVIYLLFILQSTVFLGIERIGNIVQEVVYFIFSAIGAAIIVVVGYILGGFFEEHIRKSEGAYKNLVGRVVNFLTIYVAISIALQVMGLPTTLINNILLIIVASFGLGFALALGLGLKDIVAKEAEKHIGDIEKTISRKRRK